MHSPRHKTKMCFFETHISFAKICQMFAPDTPFRHRNVRPGPLRSGADFVRSEQVVRALCTQDQEMEFGPGVSELSSLSSAEDTALLENTRQRYDASHIYTRSGRLLLAVNPYRKLSCYTDKVLEQYKASLQPQAELPPHVYAVASSAHLGMMQNSQSQVPSPRA